MVAEKSAELSLSLVMGLEREKPRLDMAQRFGADVVVNVDRSDAEEAASRATVKLWRHWN